jgi:hypothetical protein
MHNDEIFTKLKHFKSQLKSLFKKNEFPKIYAATIDLEKCYDNVDTIQLYDIVKNLLNDTSSNCTEVEKSLVVHKYTVSHYIKSLEHTVSRAVRYVASTGDVIPIRGITHVVNIIM